MVICIFGFRIIRRGVVVENVLRQNLRIQHKQRLARTLENIGVNGADFQQCRAQNADIYPITGVRADADAITHSKSAVSARSSADDVFHHVLQCDSQTGTDDRETTTGSTDVPPEFY